MRRGRRAAVSAESLRAEASAAPAKNSAGRLSRASRANTAFEREFGFGGLRRRLPPRVRTADEQRDAERQLEDRACGLVRVLTDGQRGACRARTASAQTSTCPSTTPIANARPLQRPCAAAEHHERRAQRDRARPGDEGVQEDLEDDRVHGRRPGALARLRVALGAQPAQGEEAEDRRDQERDAAEHEHGGERRCRRDAERGEAGGERGLGDADATGDRRDVADHARADLHDDELGEVEVLVEREEAQAEQRGVDQVAGGVAADELQGLLRDCAPPPRCRCAAA